MGRDLTANDVASYLLMTANDLEVPLSNLKLQKMLYYAQGWHLAVNGSALFPDSIEAWIHGPVVPSVYQVYKNHGFGPLTADTKPPHLAKETKEFLGTLFRYYIKFSPHELELATHREEPWKAAREGLAPDQPSRNTISRTALKHYFKSLMSKSR
jgi:uncharacterized phage-associated protein